MIETFIDRVDRLAIFVVKGITIIGVVCNGLAKKDKDFRSNSSTRLMKPDTRFFLPVNMPIFMILLPPSDSAYSGMMNFDGQMVNIRRTGSIYEPIVVGAYGSQGK